jgi:putative endonuclease
MSTVMDRRRTGAIAEEAVAAALARGGFRVVARNVRLRGGELDVVCWDREGFLFCEVKARRPSGFGVAAEALTATKRRRLERLAYAYLARIGRRDAPFRIALLAVDLDDRGAASRIELVPLQ